MLCCIRVRVYGRDLWEKVSERCNSGVTLSPPDWRPSFRYVNTLLTFGKAFVLCQWLTVLTLLRGDRHASYSPLREYFVNFRQSLRPMPMVNGARVAERRPAGVCFFLRYVSTLLTFGKAFVLCRWLTGLSLTLSSTRDGCRLLSAT